MPRITSRYEQTRAGGKEVAAFIAEPLPPHDPALALDEVALLPWRAEAALGRLNRTSAIVPSVGWFLYSFVRMAVTTPQVEGTRATRMDLFAFEATGKAASSETGDVREVCSYHAIAYARGQLNSPKGPPLSVRLHCETHRRLMKGVHGLSVPAREHTGTLASP
jgi:hypothetical protein